MEQQQLRLRHWLVDQGLKQADIARGCNWCRGWVAEAMNRRRMPRRTEDQILRWARRISPGTQRWDLFDHTSESRLDTAAARVRREVIAAVATEPRHVGWLTVLAGSVLDAQKEHLYQVRPGAIQGLLDRMVEEGVLRAEANGLVRLDLLGVDELAELVHLGLIRDSVVCETCAYHNASECECARARPLINAECDIYAPAYERAG